MNITEAAMIISILAGLGSVPFVASSVTSDYNYSPIPNININDSDQSTNGKTVRSLSSEGFEGSFQTPYGEYNIEVTSNKVHQELTSPDKEVTINKEAGGTTWKLVSEIGVLEVVKSGMKKQEVFRSSNGYLKIIKELGNKTKEIQGNHTKIQQAYEKAKQTLQEEVERMEKIREDYMQLPGEPKQSEMIAINEFLPNPNGSDKYKEWIEIYNWGSKSVDLSGWEITDNTTTYSINRTIDSKGYMILDRNDTDIALNNNGDTIKLLDSDGKLIDSHTYPDSTENQSWARKPDGTGDFVLSDPTPGSSNS